MGAPATPLAALLGTPNPQAAQALQGIADALTRQAVALEAIRETLASLTTRLADGTTAIRSKAV